MNQIVTIILFLILVACNKEVQEAEIRLQNKIDSLSFELKKVNRELSQVKKFPLKTSSENFNNEDFDSFFFHFMTDSAFQRTRVKFPLKYITWATNSNGDIDLGGEIDTIHIDDSKWKYDSFYFNFASERTQVYDNYSLKLRPSNERLLHWYGIENGGDAKYYFKGFGGKWYLIEKEQLGD